MEEIDTIKEFLRQSEKPLAELCQKTLQEIEIIKEDIDEYTAGVAIGISPTDKILNELSRGEITQLLTKIFMRIRMRGSDGRAEPIAPLSLLLVGEFSPKFRWHYHGLLKVNDVTTLDYIKRRLNKVIGRTVTEQINNTVNYVNYMFKQYECPEHGYFYNWNIKECLVRVDK